MKSDLPNPDLALAIPGLEIRERIGKGGMGWVYKAYQIALDRLVALKTVQPELLTKEGLELFQSEARLLAKCSHPNIVKILEFHPENTVPYFLMEFVDGVPLDQALRGRSWTERALVFLDVVATIACAHDYGVVHGDLKPANILVDRRCKPHILDFGLARLAREAPGEAGERFGGTLGFLAPEVLDGRVSPGFTSDVYALGVTLYVLLTGVLPYQNLEEARAGKMRLPLEHDSGIPEPLQRICLKAMEQLPQDRYQTVELLQRDLERFCQGKPVLVRPSAYLRELESRIRNHLSEIQLWEQQGFISRRERDALVKPYDRVSATDSPWLSETRKVLAGLLFLRLGAWFLLLSSLLWPMFYWEQLQQWSRVASAGIPTILMAVLGIGYHVLGYRRNALACLGSFALLFLVFEVILLSEFHWLAFLQPPDWELWGNQVHKLHRRTEFMLSNSQIFAATLSVTVCIVLLLRYLRAWFFAPWLAAACLGLFGALQLLVGDKERLCNHQVAWVALHSLGCAVALNFLGVCLERWAMERVAKPFYLMAAGAFLVAAVTLARYGSEEWFGEAWDFDSESWNLWLMSYSVLFFLWAWLSERHGTESQRALTWIGYSLAPVFALVPLNLLFAEKGPELFLLGPQPMRLYELVYLLTCIGILAAGKQLRIESFLLTGLWGLAIWIFRVTFRHFDGYLGWPLCIGLTGCFFIALGIWCSRRYDRRRQEPARPGTTPGDKTELYGSPPETVPHSN